MHSYLRAIGFSELQSRKELEAVLRESEQSYDEKMVVAEDRHLFTEFSKSYGFDIGIRVCGEYNEDDEFEREYYFPYFRGTGITTAEEAYVEQRSEKECFSGGCDDVRMGVTLIFYLENAGDYLKEKYRGSLGKKASSITLSGLSTEGRILFPIMKNGEQKEQERQSTRKRHQMINEARNGSEEAMERLTMDDMDTYAMISRRIATEDVFSIVDSYFMPYGMECDRYNVLGEIVDLVECENSLTKEKLCQMTLECNDMQFDICINRKDLLGEPAIGRRFKGIIWLQGHLNY